MSNAMDFLLWTKGPAFDVALAIFLIGVLLRLLEIFVLGRKPNYAEPRGPELSSGFRTIVSGFLADAGTFKRATFLVIVGYIWHIGFLVVLLLFVPHIELFNNVLGLAWPGLPTPIVDAIAAVTIVALVAVLIHRVTQPVMRFLSTPEDYLVWVATLLPLLTGYLAYHRLVNPYPLILGIHILTVEFLLIIFPFTKLMHTFTAFPARWFNGAMAGRKGVQS